MLIDGVGDEVTGTLGSILVFVAFVLIAVLNKRSQQVHLHPDSDAMVEAVRRERLGSREEADESSSGQDRACPVCLDPSMQNSVETNCGHRFCAQCILEYWRQDQWPEPARCPVCRRPVTLLLADTSPSPELQRQVEDYNQRMSGQWRPLIHYLYDVPVLLRHLWGQLWSERGPLLLHRLYLVYLLVILLIYVLSPLDILPEAVFGVVGFLDDVLFVLILAFYIAFLYRAFLTQRNE